MSYYCDYHMMYALFHLRSHLLMHSLCKVIVRDWPTLISGADILNILILTYGLVFFFTPNIYTIIIVFSQMWLSNRDLSIIIMEERLVYSSTINLCVQNDIIGVSLNYLNVTWHITAVDTSTAPLLLHCADYTIQRQVTPTTSAWVFLRAVAS